MRSIVCTFMSLSLLFCQLTSAAVLSMKFEAPVMQFDKNEVHLQLEKNQYVKVPRALFKNQSLAHMKKVAVTIHHKDLKQVIFYKK